MYLPEIYIAFITFWIETTDTPECAENSFRNPRSSVFVFPLPKILARTPATITFGVCSNSSSGDLKISLMASRIWDRWSSLADKPFIIRSANDNWVFSSGFSSA